ncbi:CBS domain-containing protein [uncultured Thiodictyon sp.]|jgi:CBS domain-containing protein|uniref:CBS domain-containing protein n=1 Tax=uncultured Thiodictyon sp. TaxID=1846217 RepID=UPI0025E3CC91|nr:CBS domain-containing protein [uncultured Thiodictyon sp.]
MKTIERILTQKGHQVWSIDPDASVLEALTLMAEKRIGALLVMDATGPVGIISERDYARSVALKGKTSRATPVRQIMTSPVVRVGPHQSVQEALALVTDRRVRHLPVMDGDQLLGLVSIGDLVKAIIAEQQLLIEQLEGYINA